MYKCLTFGLGGENPFPHLSFLPQKGDPHKVRESQQAFGRPADP